MAPIQLFRTWSPVMAQLTPSVFLFRLLGSTFDFPSGFFPDGFGGDIVLVVVGEAVAVRSFLLPMSCDEDDEPGLVFWCTSFFHFDTISFASSDTDLSGFMRSLLTAIPTFVSWKALSARQTRAVTTTPHSSITVPALLPRVPVNSTGPPNLTPGLR